MGVVIYELCCLKNPFNIESIGNLNLLVNPGSFLDNIPQEYSHVLNKCIRRMLERDPLERIDIKEIL
jgi:NIMA (never in mitosis gene a)-related kinase